jgi:ABC-type antimicrobial peptide transport system permease subunit
MAVGAQRRDNRRQFLTEAIALALAGGCVGIVAGCIGAVIIAASWLAGSNTPALTNVRYRG